MNIVATQYSINNKALEIYLAGCDGQCGCDCHNRELWDFNIGHDYKICLPKLKQKILDFELFLRNIWILGGEPLLQDHDDLVNLLSEVYNLKQSITLFTRMELKDIPNDILEYCAYVKCGPYISDYVVDDNIQYGIKLSTSNQMVYKKGKDY